MCTVQTPGLLAGAGSPAGLVGRLACVTVCVMCACGCRGHGQGLEKRKGMRRGGTVAAATAVSWAGAPAWSETGERMGTACSPRACLWVVTPLPLNKTLDMLFL